MDQPSIAPDKAQPVSLWQTVKGDFAEATGLRVVGVAAVLAWMAFQWGWGNDILLPSIVARAFDSVDDGETWLSGVGAVGAGSGAGSLFWALTQSLDAVIVLSGVRMLPGITQRISNFLTRKGWVKPFYELSLGTRFLIAYASGASVLCLVDVFATGRQGIGSRIGMVVQAVALSVAGVGTVLLVVTSLAAIGSRVPATKGAADVLIRYASNPLTWLVIFGLIAGISAIASRLNNDEDETKPQEN